MCFLDINLLLSFALSSLGISQASVPSNVYVNSSILPYQYTVLISISILILIYQ